MNGEIKIHSVVYSSVVAVMCLTFLVIAWSVVNPIMIYAAIGMCTLMITLFPLLFLRNYDFFSPWTFVLLAVVTGCTFQAICMSIGWPTEEQIDGWMLLGREPEYFIVPGAIYLLGFACFTAGYFLIGRPSNKQRVISRNYDHKNLIFIIGACFAVSMAATGAFVKFTGGGTSDKLSQKRTLIRTTDVANDDEYKQYGYLKQLSKLTPICFLTVYAYIIYNYRRINFLHGCLLAFMFVCSCLMPYYSSMRAPICWLVFYALGVSYYLERDKFKLRFAVLMTIGVLFFVTMSLGRNVSADSEGASFQESVRRVLFNRNGPGFAKTAHIINAIPDKLDYQYGQTIAVWLIAPIPREVFPAKPMVHTGPIIGQQVYGHNISGVPPGLIAELFWNFHIPGVIFGMTLIGWGLRSVYSWFQSLAINPAITVPIYLFSVIPIGYSVIGHSLGYGTVMRFVDFATVAIVVIMCTSQTTQFSLAKQKANAPS